MPCTANAQNCIVGACVPCPSGTQNCNGDSSDGCEVNLDLTTSCGTTCANQVNCQQDNPTCLAGVCGEAITPVDCAGSLTSGDLNITSAADITAFQTAKTTCISGNLNINSTGLTDLTGLNALQWVGGNISISSNGSMTKLTGLSGLTTVKGGLSIQSNSVLNDFTALSALQTIGGDLYIYNDTGIQTSIGGFGSLVKVFGNVTLQYLTAMPHLDGFPVLSEVGGYISLLQQRAPSISKASRAHERRELHQHHGYCRTSEPQRRVPYPELCG